MYRLNLYQINRFTNKFPSYSKSEKEFATDILPITAITCIPETKVKKYLSYYISSKSLNIWNTKQVVYDLLNLNLENVLSYIDICCGDIWSLLNDYILRQKIDKAMYNKYINTEIILKILSSPRIMDETAHVFLNHLCNRDLNLTHTIKLKKEYISYMWKHVSSSITAKALVLNLPDYSSLASMYEKNMFSSVMYNAIVNKLIVTDNLLDFIKLRRDPTYEYSIMNGIHGDCYVWIMTWHISSANPVNYLDFGTAFTPVNLETGKGWGGFFASLTYHRYARNEEILNNAIDHILLYASKYKIKNVINNFRL